VQGLLTVRSDGRRDSRASRNSLTTRCGQGTVTVNLIEGQFGTTLPRSGREADYRVIQIRLKKGERVEKALKRLKKIMDKEGMMKQVRANRYYESPSEKRRKKSARARARLMMSRAS